MTRSELTAALRRAGAAEPETEAALLLDHLFGEGASTRGRDADFSSPTLDDAVARRGEGVPVQYLLGEWFFMNEIYEVNEHCLIPRPDTELLAEYAIRHLPSGARFADLCTGSGCVAISVLAARSDTSCDALELFSETLALARRNAERNGVASRFTPVLADVLRGEGIPEVPRYAAILSNPPYIPTGVLGTLSREVGHEPRAALDGGEDGLLFYRAILAQYTRALLPDGEFWFEIGYDQADAIRALATAHGFDAAVFRDLGGNDRLAVLKRSAGAYSYH